MNKKHIIDEIIRAAKENNGKPLGVQKFERITGIKRSDWFGVYWTKWGDAIKEAGFKPNEFQSAYDQNKLIEYVITLIREIKKFPTTGEIRLKSHDTPEFPSHDVFSRRLGKKYEMAQKILDYCKSNSGYEDIIEICEKVLDSSEKPEREVDFEEAEPRFSYVYLMKSGQYYKIGKGDCVEKRNYEIGIKLPEELKIIHKIKTNHPFEAESYWHEVFKDKRKKGEWFNLSSSDVKDFSRRKFM
ncbi:MAG: GIY-YIG nuclease family protein [Phycisphaerae bacterium]